MKKEPASVVALNRFNRFCVDITDSDIINHDFYMGYNEYKKRTNFESYRGLHCKLGKPLESLLFLENVFRFVFRFYRF